jgi:hypothetical protein
MITVTRDPISLNDVQDIEHAPCLLEGHGENALKIYFESEANLQEYVGIEIHSGVSSAGLKKIFDEMADNPNTGSIN